MTTVRKHSTRRFHAPNKGKAFPNALRGKNARRMAKGVRKIHPHQNVVVCDLEVAMKHNKTKAVYGWMKGRISNMMSHLNREEHFHPGFIDSKGGQALQNDIAKLQRAKNIMEHIMADREDTTIFKVQKTTFPTYSKFYPSGIEPQEAHDSVKDCLKTLSEEDERFVNVSKAMY